MASPTQPAVKELLEKRSGQEFKILDLYSLFPDWKPRTSSSYDSSVAEAVNSWAERCT